MICAQRCMAINVNCVTRLVLYQLIVNCKIVYEYITWSIRESNDIERLLFPSKVDVLDRR